MAPRESTGNARIDKFLGDLDATAEKLNEYDPLYDYDLQDIENAKRRVEAFIWAYEDGKKLYSRETLADLDAQLRAGGPVKLMDLAGNIKEHEISVPKRLRDMCDEYCIQYEAYQRLAHFSPAHPESLLHEHAPISLGYREASKPTGQSAADLQKAFYEYQKEWQGSETRQNILRMVADIQPTVAISKIVCFGLGRLSYLKADEDEHIAQTVSRCNKQHAFALTMAEAVKEWASDAAAHNVGVYSQEPAYDDFDKKVLRNIGITPVDDPTGFLEIDENTLVITSHPNIPVKQVVADGPWPAAMIWNRVTEESEERREWRREVMDGDEVLISPYTTDPDSSRVRDMVKSYTWYRFPNDDGEVFGGLEAYVRK